MQVTAHKSMCFQVTEKLFHTHTTYCFGKILLNFEKLSNFVTFLQPTSEPKLATDSQYTTFFAEKQPLVPVKWLTLNCLTALSVPLEIHY